MFLHVQRMINEIVPDEPDPAAANALQDLGSAAAGGSGA
jgi:Mn-containing catalase